MKQAPIVHDSGAAILNIDAARGRTKPTTSFGRPRSRSAASISAGSDAIDELELNAISCGGSAAFAKRRIGIFAAIATTGYSSRMTSTHAIEYATMKKPS